MMQDDNEYPLDLNNFFRLPPQIAADVLINAYQGGPAVSFLELAWKNQFSAPPRWLEQVQYYFWKRLLTLNYPQALKHYKIIQETNKNIKDKNENKNENENKLNKEDDKNVNKNENKNENKKEEQLHNETEDFQDWIILKALYEKCDFQKYKWLKSLPLRHLYQQIKVNNVGKIKYILSKNPSITFPSVLEPGKKLGLSQQAALCKAQEALNLFYDAIESNKDKKVQKKLLWWKVCCHQDLSKLTEEEVKQLIALDGILELAASHSYEDTVKYLVEKGAVITQKTFIYAVACGSKELVLYLHQKNPKILQDESFAEQILKEAASRGKSYVDLVLSLGVDKKKGMIPDSLSDVITSRNLKLVTEWISYCIEEKSKKLGKSVKFKEVFSLETSSQALLNAASAEDIDIVEYLLNQGVDINSLDKEVIHKAAKRGQLQILHFLKTHINEKEPDAFKNKWLTKRDKNNCTPLQCAVIGGDFYTVQYLISEGAEINVTHNRGFNLLQLAGEHGYSAHQSYLIAENLIKQGLKIDRLPVPETIGITETHFKIINFLIEKNLVDINAKNANGETALHVAARSGNMALIKYLISKGADLKAVTPKGVTILHSAAKNKQVEVMKYLVEEQKILVDSTVLHHVIPLEDIDLVKWVVNQKSSLEEKKSLINEKDTHGYTALHYAAMENSLRMLTYFVELGGDLNAKTYDEQETPYQSALQGSDVEKYLEEKYYRKALNAYYEKMDKGFQSDISLYARLMEIIKLPAPHEISNKRKSFGFFSKPVNYKEFKLTVVNIIKNFEALVVVGDTNTLIEKGKELIGNSIEQLTPLKNKVKNSFLSYKVEFINDFLIELKNNLVSENAKDEVVEKKPEFGFS